MTAIETGAAALPYPWGDRLEVVLRGIGGSIWMQFAFAIVIVRVIVWLIARLIGYCLRRRRLTENRWWSTGEWIEDSGVPSEMLPAREPFRCLLRAG